MSKTFTKTCGQCGEEFTCNGGCRKIRGRGFIHSMCYCPDCANMTRGMYPVDLKKVCSRFDISEEKVVFN